MGPMFNSVAGSMLNAAAGSSLSLPSSPNGFAPSMLPGSLSHSPPSMASHFQSNASMNNIGGRESAALLQQQSSRRRHSNTMPISAGAGYFLLLCFSLNGFKMCTTDRWRYVTLWISINRIARQHRISVNTVISSNTMISLCTNPLHRMSVRRWRIHAICSLLKS